MEVILLIGISATKTDTASSAFNAVMEALITSAAVRHHVITTRKGTVRRTAVMKFVWFM
jgi:hypothetical protein